MSHDRQPFRDFVVLSAANRNAAINGTRQRKELFQSYDAEIILASVNVLCSCVLDDYSAQGDKVLVKVGPDWKFWKKATVVKRRKDGVLCKLFENKRVVLCSPPFVRDHNFDDSNSCCCFIMFAGVNN